MKHLNIVINPVERWFHYEKPLPIEISSDTIVSFLKDSKENDVICLSGWGTYKCL